MPPNNKIRPDSGFEGPFYGSKFDQLWYFRNRSATKNWYERSSPLN